MSDEREISYIYTEICLSLSFWHVSVRHLTLAIRLRFAHQQLQQLVARGESSGGAPGPAAKCSLLCVFGDYLDGLMLLLQYYSRPH